METREKKFYAPELKTYDYDLSARWRIEWLEPTYNNLNCKRVVKYGNINKGKSIEERILLANLLVESLDFHSPRKIDLNIIEKTIEHYKYQWRKKSTQAYNTISESYKKFLGHKIKPEKANSFTINEYLLYLQKSGLSNNTVAKYRNLLHTLYKKAISLGYTNKNPVTRVPQIKRNYRSLNFFSDTQIQKFREADISCQLWLAIQFLFYCFIRPGEMRLLKISDINFEYSFIEVRGEISKNGKTEKVALPHFFKEQILNLQAYPNNYYILSKKDTPGTIPVSTKWINDEHRKVLAKLKITGRYAFYSWKHTGVVKAVKAGINIKDLQLQLRHHSLDMVNEYLKNLGVLDSEDLRNRYPTL